MINKKNTKYTKQIKLDGFGISAQEKLFNAKVLIIGAGGLGCPAITYLAAAGVGTLGIIDHDLVDETNLHRQPIYTSEDIGQPKVTVSAARAQKLNPDAKIIAWQKQLSPSNALEIIRDFNVILDCTDNYEARYLINDACVLLNKPWIYGAVEAWEGQLAAFNFPKSDGSKTPTYRCLFPEPSAEAISCNDIGVIGTMPGTVGIMQANEAIKLITGIGEVQNGLLLIDLLHNNFQKIKVTRNEEAITLITSLKENYDADCNTETSYEIAMDNVLKTPDKYFIIDIREEYELDESPFELADLNLPMDQLLGNAFAFRDDMNYVLVCAKGNRSLQTVKKLKQIFPDINLFSAKGGVAAIV